jgi:hypothetical protein
MWVKRKQHLYTQVIPLDKKSLKVSFVELNVDYALDFSGIPTQTTPQERS